MSHQTRSDLKTNRSESHRLIALEAFSYTPARAAGIGFARPPGSGCIFGGMFGLVHWFVRIEGACVGCLQCLHVWLHGSIVFLVTLWRVPEKEQHAAMLHRITIFKIELFLEKKAPLAGTTVRPKHAICMKLYKHVSKPICVNTNQTSGKQTQRK